MSIKNFILKIDKECTRLLKKKIIVNENSFTAVFTIKIYEKLYKHYNTYAFVLEQKHEKRLGCDAIIIIKKNNCFCLGFWEAKRLRKSWDKFEKKNGISHFTKQIRIQDRNKGFCFWEMFYNDKIKFKKFKDDCSFCVWKKDMLSINDSIFLNKSCWNDKYLLDLEKLGKGKNIKQILQELTINCCKNIDNKQNDSKNNEFSFKQGDKIFKVPFYNFEIKNNKQIKCFLDEYGLTSYIFIDLDTLN
jgi:hypothetical protein